jgi:hypothetical protein
MQQDQIKLLIKKIKRIYQDISESPGTVSNIERDLLLQYIRDLYEAASSIKSESRKSNEPNFEIPPLQQVKEVMENPANQAPAEIGTVEVEAQETKPAETPTPKPVEIEAEQQPPVLEPEAEIQETTTDDVSDKLFDLKVGSDLSDLLSQQKIVDIGKHLGINDRILIVNELFGGNSEDFNLAIQELNTCSSPDEAKTYISSTLATKYGWHEKNRLDTAKSFIRLVLRKFK